MLNQRIQEFTTPLLHADETITVAMAGFRPLSRSAMVLSVFPLFFGGLAAGTAAGISPWLGGAVAAGLGFGMAAWLDQRRARAEHDGKSLSIGLVVTNRRLLILDLVAGLVAASVAGVHLEQKLENIREVEPEKMQGSGLKRIGAVITFRDGSATRVIPAKTKPFLEALQAG